MDLRPLYEVKERLEAAAVAGTGLLPEDFRLRRAAEALKPLADAGPVLARIDAGLEGLLSAPAEERAGALLDLLALADAAIYTQAGTGAGGELVPLSAGGGQYRELSYDRLHPLLEALTATGGGRLEVLQSAWETQPEVFSDFRVLPALVDGLGDGYGEIADLCAGILARTGPAAVPLLKEGFDPAGKKEMARRVEAVAAVEGPEATPWLREILPLAKKDVRAAVIEALGTDAGNAPLLLELAQTEKGGREAVLKALSRQDGETVAAFWAEELDRRPGSVLFLRDTDAEWAGTLIGAGLRDRLERMLAHGGRVPAAEQTELSNWCQAIGKKTAMVDFWRWADEHMETFDTFTNEKGGPIFAGVRLTDTLRDCLRTTGPGPLRDFCLGLFDSHPAMTRYLHISFLASLLALPAAEVYERFAPYVLTEIPEQDADRARTLNTVLLRALGDVWRDVRGEGYRVYGGQSTAEPLDRRWIGRLLRAVCTDVPRRGGTSPFAYYWENVGEFDLTLMRLADPDDREQREALIPYLQRRLEETGLAYTYSRWLFRLGGDPRGVWGRAMARDPKANHLYNVWELMREASKVLPGEALADLLEEFQEAGAVPKQRTAPFQRILPWAVQRLRAGEPLPEWEEWDARLKA